MAVRTGTTKPHSNTLAQTSHHQLSLSLLTIFALPEHSQRLFVYTKASEVFRNNISKHTVIPSGVVEYIFHFCHLHVWCVLLQNEPTKAQQRNLSVLIGRGQRTETVVTYLILYNRTERQCQQGQILGETAPVLKEE